MKDGESPDGDKEPIDGGSPAPEGLLLSEDLLEEGVEGTVAPTTDLSVERESRRLSADLTAVLVAGRLPNS